MCSNWNSMVGHTSSMEGNTSSRNFPPPFPKIETWHSPLYYVEWIKSLFWSQCPHMVYINMLTVWVNIVPVYLMVYNRLSSGFGHWKYPYLPEVAEVKINNNSQMAALRSLKNNSSYINHFVYNNWQSRYLCKNRLTLCLPSTLIT